MIGDFHPVKLSVVLDVESSFQSFLSCLYICYGNINQYLIVRLIYSLILFYLVGIICILK